MLTKDCFAVENEKKNTSKESKKQPTLVVGEAESLE